LFNPALLSNLATEFQRRIKITVDAVDGVYRFNGKQAVEIVCDIMKSTDVKFATKLGRVLEDERVLINTDPNPPHKLRYSRKSFYTLNETSADTSKGMPDSGVDMATRMDIPTGVLTHLHGCYRPRCNGDDPLCYSVVCRKQNKFNKELPSVPRESDTSEPLQQPQQQQPQIELWSTTVPREVVDSVSKEELKRQEVIFELVDSEKEYHADLKTLRESFIKPLRSGDAIPENRRNEFGGMIEYNLSSIMAISSKLSRALLKRQEEEHIVDKIGDIFLEFSTKFNPYIPNCANYPMAKYHLDREASNNESLESLIRGFEKLPQTRKLSIHSFLSRPFTRLPKLQLLLDNVLKRTPADHPDRVDLSEAIANVRSVLNQIDSEVGKANDRLRIYEIASNMQCTPEEHRALDLGNPRRILIKEGTMKRRAGVESYELTVFLFDHLLVFARAKKAKEHTAPIEYKLYRQPIPLTQLNIAIVDTVSNSTAGHSTIGIASSLPSTAGAFTQRAGSGKVPQSYAFTISHLGRNGGEHYMTLNTFNERKEWLERIDGAQKKRALIERWYDFTALTSVTLPFASTRINCSVLFDEGHKIALGTTSGIYVGVVDHPNSFVKMKAQLDSILMIEILDQFETVLIVAGKNKTLYTFSMDVLEWTANDPPKGRKVINNVQFMRSGVCNGRTLVAVSWTSGMSTHGQIFVPIATQAHKRTRDRNTGGFSRLLGSGSSGVLRRHREFYVPSVCTSLHWLRTKLLVGCHKGFEMVDPDSMQTQSLLDPSDKYLDMFIDADYASPIDIIRINESSSDFLLCYNTFAFFVTGRGQRAKPDWIIYWEGSPTGFAVQHPYILAFSPRFVEVYHLDSRKLVQTVPLENCHLLMPSSNK
ncbi:hypothetical protein GQ42DRAFT_104054, partial [Ramicandelaber brevisporus]